MTTATPTAPPAAPRTPASAPRRRPAGDIDGFRGPPATPPSPATGGTCWST
ncbi:hypothetical protein [Streptomyces noursei]|uniref:hypothetical protein n=1 Tax=Streptomyces noursei TaxID=1971 RepID=UPI003809D302